MKKLKWIFAVAVVFTAVACCPCRKSKSPSLPLTGIEWKMTQMYGTNIDSDNYRITFGADGSAHGVGDCNRFTGSYTMKDGELKIGESLASTRMMCMNQAQEDKFLKMLGYADAYYVDGEKLMLIKNGEVISMFSPAEAKTE